MAKRCLYCYRKLEDESNGFHLACSKKIFGTPQPPILDITTMQLANLAKKVIQSKQVITGVQPKLSLGINKERNGLFKFTILGLMDNYILKPASKTYPHLPELEDVTMHLAELSKIKTVPHSLIRMTSGELAYLTKRIDRNGKLKIHMEDMCQLTNRLTEQKYNGSYEQLAKTIYKFSVNPVLDVVNFYEQVIFSFLTGNSDMHFKNFSLIDEPGIGYHLSPAYDMLSSALALKDDKEELALTLNSRKNKIKRADFMEAFRRIKMEDRVTETIFNKFKNVIPRWKECIDTCFLPRAMKDAYKNLINRKVKQVGL